MNSVVMCCSTVFVSIGRTSTFSYCCANELKSKSWSSTARHRDITAEKAFLSNYVIISFCVLCIIAHNVRANGKLGWFMAIQNTAITGIVSDYA